MRSRLSLFAVISILILAWKVIAAPHALAEGAAPFYVWQEDVPSDAGVLLRHEPLEEKLVLSEASAGVRILYSSHGWNDLPVTVSGDVLIPKGIAPEGGWPVLAWSHGTMGVADLCAPSFKGRSGRDIKYLNKWLAEGYAIVSTDYEGLGTPGGHAYLHCQSEPSNWDLISPHDGWFLANRRVVRVRFAPERM